MHLDIAYGTVPGHRQPRCGPPAVSAVLVDLWVDVPFFVLRPSVRSSRGRGGGGPEASGRMLSWRAPACCLLGRLQAGSGGQDVFLFLVALLAYGAGVQTVRTTWVNAHETKQRRCH